MSVIAAEGQGDVTQYTHSAPAYGSAPSYGSQMTQEDWDRNLYGSSGAGGYTMNVMMGFVFIGYFVLFAVYTSMCCFGPSLYGFARFHDVEIAGQPKPQLTGPVAELDAMWRKQFISKVYGILCMQLAVTFVICYAMMQLGGYNLYMWTMTSGYWTRSLSMILTLVTLVALFCYKNRHPFNFFLLGCFTVSMSYLIGVTCTAYAAMGYSVVVVEAFAITSLLFVGLTLFVRYSKIDFSFLGLVLPMLLMTLIIFGLFSMFAFPSFAFRQVYALLGCLIFVGYVLFDTSMIITYLNYDDYILGAINLYLDFINLFMFILQLLMGGRRD